MIDNTAMIAAAKARHEADVKARGGKTNFLNIKKLLKDSNGEAVYLRILAPENGNFLDVMQKVESYKTVANGKTVRLISEKVFLEDGQSKIERLLNHFLLNGTPEQKAILTNSTVWRNGKITNRGTWDRERVEHWVFAVQTDMTGKPLTEEVKICPLFNTVKDQIAQISFSDDQLAQTPETGLSIYDLKKGRSLAFTKTGVGTDTKYFTAPTAGSYDITTHDLKRPQASIVDAVKACLLTDESITKLFGNLVGGEALPDDWRGYKYPELREDKAETEEAKPTTTAADLMDI